MILSRMRSASSVSAMSSGEGEPHFGSMVKIYEVCKRRGGEFENQPSF